MVLYPLYNKVRLIILYCYEKTRKCLVLHVTLHYLLKQDVTRPIYEFINSHLKNVDPVRLCVFREGFQHQDCLLKYSQVIFICMS